MVISGRDASFFPMIAVRSADNLNFFVNADGVSFFALASAFLKTTNSCKSRKIIDSGSEKLPHLFCV